MNARAFEQGHELPTLIAQLVSADEQHNEGHENARKDSYPPPWPMRSGDAVERISNAADHGQKSELACQARKRDKQDPRAPPGAGIQIGELRSHNGIRI